MLSSETSRNPSSLGIFSSISKVYTTWQARREDAAEDQPGSQHIAEHGHHVETLAAAREAIHVGRPTWAAVGA